jgi:predicted transcriptional regulator
MKKLQKNIILLFKNLKSHIYNYVMNRAFTKNEMLTFLVEKGIIKRYDSDRKYTYIYVLSEELKKLTN